MALKLCIFNFFVTVLIVNLSQATHASPGYPPMYNVAAYAGVKPSKAQAPLHARVGRDDKIPADDIGVTANPTDGDKKIDPSNKSSTPAVTDNSPKAKAAITRRPSVTERQGRCSPYARNRVAASNTASNADPNIGNPFDGLGDKVKEMGKKISQGYKSAMDKVNSAISPSSENSSSSPKNAEDEPMVSAVSSDGGVPYFVISDNSADNNGAPDDKGKSAGDRMSEFMKIMDTSSNTPNGRKMMPNNVASLRKAMDEFQKSMRQKEKEKSSNPGNDEDPKVGAGNQEENSPDTPKNKEEKSEAEKQPKSNTEKQSNADELVATSHRRPQVILLHDQPQRPMTYSSPVMYYPAYVYGHYYRPRHYPCVCGRSSAQMNPNSGSGLESVDYSNAGQYFGQYNPYQMFWGSPSYPLAKRSVDSDKSGAENKEQTNADEATKITKRSSDGQPDNIWDATSGLFDSIVRIAPKMAQNATKDARASEILKNGEKLITRAYSYASQFPQFVKIPSAEPNSEIFLAIKQNPDGKVDAEDFADEVEHENFLQNHPVGSVLKSANQMVEQVEGTGEGKPANPAMMINQATNLATSLLGAVANVRRDGGSHAPGLVDESGTVLLPAVRMFGRMLSSAVNAGAMADSAGVIEKRDMYHQYYPSMVPLGPYYNYAAQPAGQQTNQQSAQGQATGIHFYK